MPVAGTDSTLRNANASPILSADWRVVVNFTERTEQIDRATRDVEMISCDREMSTFAQCDTS